MIDEPLKGYLNLIHASIDHICFYEQATIVAGEIVAGELLGWHDAAKVVQYCKFNDVAIELE